MNNTGFAQAFSVSSAPVSLRHKPPPERPQSTRRYQTVELLLHFPLKLFPFPKHMSMCERVGVHAFRWLITTTRTPSTITKTTTIWQKYPVYVGNCAAAQDTKVNRALWLAQR